MGRLPFEADTFDLVLAIEVLEHVPYPELALSELHRVARRDVVVSVPREPIWSAANLARGKYLKDLGNTPGHINHWSKKGFAELVGRRFDVRAVHSPFPWTMVAAAKA
nr:methyltransferase domain-containing protein [Aquihabitans sp. G128]